MGGTVNIYGGCQSIGPLSYLKQPTNLQDATPTTFGIPNKRAVSKNLSSARMVPWKATAARVISVLGSIALGALTVAALSGVLISPAGWAIAGAVVFIGLAGSYYYGGPKEFLKTLLFSTASF